MISVNSTWYLFLTDEVYQLWRVFDVVTYVLYTGNMDSDKSYSQHLYITNSMTIFEKLTSNTYATLAVLVVVSILQYSNILQNEFVWDAKGVFLNDKYTREFKNIPRYFTTGYSIGNMEENQNLKDDIQFAKYYRPLLKNNRSTCSTSSGRKNGISFSSLMCLSNT